MRVLFALPGLHRYDRGAETAFLAIAAALAKSGTAVTLIGSGGQRPGTPYRFVHADSIPREKFEKFPSLVALRHEFAYEELTFMPDFLRKFRPADFDLTVTCSYPYTNWALRRPRFGGPRPAHVFVTQNGDWPAVSNKSEFRFFGCDGMVCTNPEFFERNKDRWRCRLIPNGIDCTRFTIGEGQRQKFGVPVAKLVVLMVSALMPTKRVDVGIEAVSQIPDAHLVVAGDGGLRQQIDSLAARLLPGRFTRLTLASELMPMLYRSADVFLHLTELESFGNVYLEAMACGLPVVAHDSPRLRWIVGDDEFLVDTHNTASIVEAIQRARQSSAGKRQERVNKAAAFSVSRISSMYRSFFDEILAA